MNVTRLHVGPRLSQAVIHGQTIYLTGCIADRTKGRSVREQMREILATIDLSLAEAGSEKTKILSAHVHLAKIATYGEMNAEWDAWIPEGHTPARATFESKLPISGTSVMLVCVAARS